MNDRDEARQARDTAYEKYEKQLHDAPAVDSTVRSLQQIRQRNGFGALLEAAMTSRRTR